MSADHRLESGVSATMSKGGLEEKKYNYKRSKKICVNSNDNIPLGVPHLWTPSCFLKQVEFQLSGDIFSTVQRELTENYKHNHEEIRISSAIYFSLFAKAYIRTTRSTYLIALSDRRQVC